MAFAFESTNLILLLSIFRIDKDNFESTNKSNKLYSKELIDKIAIKPAVTIFYSRMPTWDDCLVYGPWFIDWQIFNATIKQIGVSCLNM